MENDMAEKKKSWKNQLICMECSAESLGKSVKECEKTFPDCGKGLGPIKDSCRVRMYQDGKPIVKVLEMAEYEKLLRVSTKVEEAKAKALSKAQASIAEAKDKALIAEAKTTAKVEPTPKETKAATKS